MGAAFCAFTMKYGDLSRPAGRDRRHESRQTHWLQWSVRESPVRREATNEEKVMAPSEEPRRRDERPRGGSDSTGGGRGGGSGSADRSARGGRGSGQAAGRSGDRRGAPGSRGGRPGGYRGRSGSDVARDADRAPRVPDGPPIPDEITGRELDPTTRRGLSGLGSKADLVARHLVAAGQLLESDPDLAADHALAASALGARIASVREAAGEAAYAAGRYDKALSELRAAKRISGSVEMLPLMADCERGLGRPERALEMATSPDVAKLSADSRVELSIVAAGARADLGDLDAGLVELEQPLLFNDAVSSTAARLRYAYADLLEQMGRRTDAAAWFSKVTAADVDEETDAAQRWHALTVGA